MTRKRRIGALAASIVVGAGLMLAGCSAAPAEESATPEPTVEVTEVPPTPEPTPEPTEAPTPSPTPALLMLGQLEEGAQQIVFTNATAGDIVNLQVKLSEAQDYEGNLLEEISALTDSTLPTIPPNEQFIYCYMAEGAQPTADPAATVAADLEEAAPAEPTEELADGREVVFNEMHDMHVVMSDGVDFVLYDLAFEDMKDVSIKYSTEDQVGYVEYTSVATNEPVSTLEAQKARVDLDQAAASAPAAAQNEPDTSSAGSDSGSSSGGGSSESSGSSGSSGSSSGSSGGSSSDSSGSTGGGSTDSSGDSGSSSGSDYVPEPEPDNGSSGGDSSGDISQDVGDCIEDNIIWND